MRKRINLNVVYKPSEGLVVRDVHGTFIIIPIFSRIDKTDDTIFSLNQFGKAIWDSLDGKRSLQKIVKTVALKFEGSQEEIESDVLGFTNMLFKKKLITKCSTTHHS